MRCADCKRIKWCFWPVRDEESGKNLGVCVKCWEKGS
jgi:hypothetical protein